MRTAVVEVVSVHWGKHKWLKEALRASHDQQLTQALGHMVNSTLSVVCLLHDRHTSQLEYFSDVSDFRSS